MNWKASRPAAEIAVEWLAATCLGGSIGFAVMRVAPYGAAVAVAAGVIVAGAALLILARVDRRRGPIDVAFAQTELHSDGNAAALAASDGGEVLLLDDPLPSIDPDSRVVRLFAASPDRAAATPPPSGPGEMIARIEDYLGAGRGSAAAAEPATTATQAASIDANAALHAALADIRRSLRQG